MENIKNFKLHESYNVIIETFNKSAKDDLIKFIKKQSIFQKYVLISDYCLNANNKYNDVYSFVVIPGLYLQTIINNVKINLPHDYKSISILTQNNKNTLLNLPYLAINIIIPNKFQKILKIPQYDNKTKEEFQKIIYSIIDMLKLWKKNNPEREHYNDYISKFQKLLQDSKSNSFNINLYMRTFFTSTIAAYIIHEIEKYSGAKTLGWGTDRDAMLSSNNEILYDLFMIQYNGFSKNDDQWIDNEECSLNILKPYQTGENWYDELIRLPDFCAGALSTLYLDDSWYKNTKISLSENQIKKAKDVIKCINTHCINIILKFDQENNTNNKYEAARMNINIK